MSKVKVDLFTADNSHVEHDEFGTHNFAEIWNAHGLTWSHIFNGPGGGATEYTLEGSREQIIAALSDAYEAEHTPDDWNCPIQQAIDCAQDRDEW